MSSKNQFVKRFLMMLTGILFYQHLCGMLSSERIWRGRIYMYESRNQWLYSYVFRHLAADYECSDPDRCIFLPQGNASEPETIVNMVCVGLRG